MVVALVNKRGRYSPWLRRRRVCNRRRWSTWWPSGRNRRGRTVCGQTQTCGEQKRKKKQNQIKLTCHTNANATKSNNKRAGENKDEKPNEENQQLPKKRAISDEIKGAIKNRIEKNGWPKRSVDLERETSRESKRKPTSAGAHFLVHNKRLRNPRRLWRATTFSSRSDEIHRQVRAVQWKNQIGQRNAVVEFLREKTDSARNLRRP